MFVRVIFGTVQKVRVIYQYISSRGDDVADSVILYLLGSSFQTDFAFEYSKKTSFLCHASGKL